MVLVKQQQVVRHTKFTLSAALKFKAPREVPVLMFFEHRRKCQPEAPQCTEGHIEREIAEWN